MSLAEISRMLGTDPATGLTQAEATARLVRQGANRLTQSAGRSTFSILAAQFKSPIVMMLAAATAISFAMGDTIEAVAILIVILLNASIGFFTEWRAARALSALRKQIVPVAHVIREGAAHQIPAEQLVTGDLVILSAGARVPADGRIVESVRLHIEEAAITGESQPVTKHPGTLSDADAPLGDRLNMAFMGTTITDGRGLLIVTATGPRTEVGRIGTLIDEADAPVTPLEQKLTRLGNLLIVMVVALCAVIVAAGWFGGVADFWHMLEIGIFLAIAAAPEGLPAVSTMTLALGMQRMARMGALIRRLPTVETLGSTTIICTDKTGTLTRNEMTVSALVLGRRRVDVTGAGYAASGTFHSGGRLLDPLSDPHLTLALRIGALCNDARVEREPGHDSVIGDPTEAALVVVAEKAGLSRSRLEAEYPRVGEVPFDSASKRMVTVHRTAGGRMTAFIKGSPAALLETSRSQLTDAGVIPLTPDDRRNWEEANKSLAGSALRVLGLAWRELPDRYDDADLARELTFVGLVGMSDPLRDEAKSAITTCREAGIRIVMITGDQQATAAEIARQLGIDRDLDGSPLRTVHARELKDLDDEGWRRAAADAAVFARVSPEHKLRIVTAFQQQREVVAMTGDGVNDAPALKKADIGVAMGIKGSEVAKETASMIITDDNFATIVGAVEQGRIVYSNILRFIHYLFSCNVSEIFAIFISLMIGWPLPLGALQILWLNMITDIFPALALALEPSAPGMMTRPPRDPEEPLVTAGTMGLIAGQGLLLAAVTLAAFAIGLNWHGAEGEGLRRATTMAFMTLSTVQIVHAFNARSRTRSIFTGGLFTNVWLWAAVLGCLALQIAAVTNPLLQRVLRTTRPTAPEWIVIAVCCLIPVAVVELVKLIRRLTATRTGT